MPVDKWRAALAAAKRLALRFPGVTGVDYGYKYEAGERTSRMCVRFHVSSKKPLDALRPHELLPSDIGFIVCDVVQAQYAPHTLPRMRSDLVRPGMSAGHAARRSTGSLGAIAREAGSGRVCLLSNWHVLCGGPGAQRGESISRPRALHPGTDPAQALAALERWLDLKQGYDAAIAVLSAGACHDGANTDIGVRISGLEEPRLGLALIRSDAASGVTHATVDGIEGMFELDYGFYGDQKHWMHGFRLVPRPQDPEDAISAAGDAGGVWINSETQRAVALHFADGDGTAINCALAHPLSRILSLLDLTF